MAVQLVNMIKHVRRYSCWTCYLLLVAVLHEGVLSSPTGKNDNQKVTVKNQPIASKRHVNFQFSSINEQQDPQDYANFYQPTNAASNEKSKFEQHTDSQVSPSDSDYVFSPTRWPTTTTSLTPFGADQIRLQSEYQDRTFVVQMTNQKRMSRPYQFQAQSQRYSDENGLVRQQLNTIGSDTQQDAVQPTHGYEPYSYAQVQFGAVIEPTEHTPVERPKGQRSLSRPRTNHPVPEPAVQQTVQNPAAVFPIQFNPRLLQNVVYVQPNGQIHRPVEDAEPVVEIPRRNNHRLYATGPATAIASGATPVPVTTAAAIPAEEEPVVLIPRPKKPENPALGRIRPEGRKPGRTQQPVKTTRPTPLQQPAEVEPDNFLTSLLYRLQQQHQQEQQPDAERGTTVVSRPRSGQRSKGGDRPDASKYLPDRSQLQLLQFPHELQALSSAELRVLEGSGAQIAAAASDDEFVGQQKRLPKSHRPVAAQTPLQAPAQPERLRAADEPFDEGRTVGLQSFGHRPVPTPVELSDEQRQFLAAQGIRNLYRVDYDQAGNALPLTYVLALDNRAKRDEQRPSATPASPADEPRDERQK